MQPYLLELHGKSGSYAIAGVAAALAAAAQIAGGLIVPWTGKVFRLRTSALLFGTLASASMLVLMGLTANFWIVLALLAGWAVIFAATIPIRQALLNGLIPSEQRATVLSSDNLLSSSCSRRWGRSRTSGAMRPRTWSPRRSRCWRCPSCFSPEVGALLPTRSRSPRSPAPWRRRRPWPSVVSSA